MILYVSTTVYRISTLIVTVTVNRRYRHYRMETRKIAWLRDRSAGDGIRASPRTNGRVSQCSFKEPYVATSATSSRKSAGTSMLQGAMITRVSIIRAICHGIFAVAVVIDIGNSRWRTDDSIMRARARALRSAAFVRNSFLRPCFGKGIELASVRVSNTTVQQLLNNERGGGGGRGL